MAGMRALQERYRQFRSDLRDANLKGLFALATGVRDFLRDQVTVQRAQEEIKRALDGREERFLELARTQIYERPASPYHRLLKLAGCEFSDLRTHVRQHGLEETLEHLAREGVYFTSDEFKGKKEVVRGGQSFRVAPADFERLDSPPGFVIQSSGTRNRPLRSVIPLDWLAIRTFGTGVFFSAHELFSYSHAMYDTILPGSAVYHLLINAKLGKKTDYWFARKIPMIPWLHGMYHHLTTYLVLVTGNLSGPGLPRPRFIDTQDIRRIVDWIAAEKRKGKASYITTITSSAVRIARAALEMGVSLEGTKFNVAGEPFTEAKEQVIKQVGASVTSRYGYGGGVNVGFGCANPSYRDEIHVDQNMLALVCHPTPLRGAGPSIRPLLCTTLYPEAPRVFLNVGNGDYATLERRDCGCALGEVGLTHHLHHIRSYEKFTSEGMNYFYGDLFELIEKSLPSEFGGGPGDYQLVEEEDSKGQTRITLVVHPGVGELDDERLLSRLRAAFSDGSRGNRFMAGVWENAGTFRIQREVPHASPRGKILPLHIHH